MRLAKSSQPKQRESDGTEYSVTVWPRGVTLCLSYEAFERLQLDKLVSEQRSHNSTGLCARVQYRMQAFVSKMMSGNMWSTPPRMLHSSGEFYSDEQNPTAVSRSASCSHLPFNTCS